MDYLVSCNCKMIWQQNALLTNRDMFANARIYVTTGGFREENDPTRQWEYTALIKDNSSSFVRDKIESG